MSGAVAAALGTFFFGRDAVSYVGTSIGWVRDSVKNAVPIDFEIQRARRLIKNLVPDIRTNMELIAKEEVEIERLQKQVAENRTRLDRDRTDIMRLKTDLASDRKEFVYAGRHYKVDQVRCDLSNRFQRYKTNESTLASLEQMQTSREQSLAAARTKLDNMLSSKRQLEVDVEHLEARLKMVETAETTSCYQFNDSQLSRAKQLVSDLRVRLDVAERLVNSENQFQGEIPVEETVSESIVDEVTEYFQPESKEVASSTSHATP
jgi:chromosome segregation ATPase